MPASSGVEVIHSPSLFATGAIQKNAVVVIVDIFRAGTTVCAAFQQGSEKIIPTASVEEALNYKEKGYLVAGEREGLKLEFADFGNSPYEISRSDLNGKNLVITSTNGIYALDLAINSEMLAIGAFTNLSYIAEWLLTLQKNIIILCSGWHNTLSLEDTLFAGALADLLLQGDRTIEPADSTWVSIDLWNTVKSNFPSYLQRGSHYQRLVKLGAQPDLDYSLKIDSTRVIPVYENYYLINILK